MELQLDMLKEYDDETIARLTGIRISTISDWREMMTEIQQAGIRVKPVYHSPEKDIQSRFVKTLNSSYQEYVRTKYGIIDILTDNSIYEVKVTLTNATIQKPVGQVILYSTEMPNRNKVIVAGKIKVSEFIERAIASLGIRLFEFS